ncbi:expressed protein [Echinococcus multilocularis]|uniref:Expressed protein n=1 Tax=Echinococcus multilocularis TaxID=6211 RepID=A0A087W181_ECHMU|nr:expressed protein [Echinococcus multilocularis]
MTNITQSRFFAAGSEADSSTPTTKDKANRFSEYHSRMLCRYRTQEGFQLRSRMMKRLITKMQRHVAHRDYIGHARKL